MTGWIKLRRYNPDAIFADDCATVYVNVDQIQAIYEEVDQDNDGMIVTVLDMITGEIKVDNDIKEVLREVKLSRPTRT